MGAMHTGGVVWVGGQTMTDTHAWWVAAHGALVVTTEQAGRTVA